MTAGRRIDFDPSLSGAWRTPVPASAPAKGEERFVLLLGRVEFAIGDRQKLVLVPAPRAVSFAPLPGTLSVFFAEWFRCSPLFAFQLCFQAMVFVSNSQRREHRQG